MKKVKILKAVEIIIIAIMVLFAINFITDVIDAYLDYVRLNAREWVYTYAENSGVILHKSYDYAKCVEHDNWVAMDAVIKLVFTMIIGMIPVGTIDYHIKLEKKYNNSFKEEA